MVGSEFLSCVNGLQLGNNPENYPDELPTIRDIDKRCSEIELHEQKKYLEDRFYEFCQDSRYGERYNTTEYIKKKLEKIKEDIENEKQNEDEPKHVQSFPKRIFISHGTSQEWRKVKEYIKNTLECETLELAEEVNKNRYVLQKLFDESDKCGFAVIVMTGDDTDKDGIKRARENVIHEIGFFQVKYGVQNTCILLEDGTYIPSNLRGLLKTCFAKDNIQTTFDKLKKEIEVFKNN
jgi:predicted nucleotide-binding protein